MDLVNRNILFCSREYDGLQTIEMYELRDPALTPLMIERDLTLGLGYKPIKHYEDSQVGLVRHLAHMERRILGSQIMFDREVMGQAFADMKFLEEYAEGVNCLLRLTNRSLDQTVESQKRMLKRLQALEAASTSK